MKYAYFPGCVAEDSCSELDRSTRLVASKLDIELVELTHSSCCGAGIVQEVKREFAIGINARTLSMAEAMGLDVMTICSTCQLYLSEANIELKSDEALRNRVNAALKRGYGGGVEVKHFLHVLTEDCGLEKLRSMVRRPLGINIAPFYGCQILRPSSVHGANPSRTRALEDVISALGGQPVEYSGRNKCCGFQVTFVEEKSALKMCADNLLEAKENGAQYMVTPCPLCHINLDIYQSRAGKLVGKKISMPVLHMSQMLGLAMGMDGKELGLKRHLVPVKGL